MRLPQRLDQLVDRGIVDRRVDWFDPNVLIRAGIDLGIDRNDDRERQWLARANVDARIANRHQIFTLERLPVEIGHEEAVGFLQEDLRSVHLLDHRLRRFSLTEARQRDLVADLAHGAAHRLGRLFFLGGNLELHAALRQPLHRQLHACASPISQSHRRADRRIGERSRPDLPKCQRAAGGGGLNAPETRRWFANRRV